MDGPSASLALPHKDQAELISGLKGRDPFTAFLFSGAGRLRGANTRALLIPAALLPRVGVDFKSRGLYNPSSHTRAQQAGTAHSLSDCHINSKDPRNYG